jgi:hypothetical protein
VLGLLKRSLICSLAYATESGGRENVIDRSSELQTCDVSLVCGEDKVSLGKTRLKNQTSLIRFLVEVSALWRLSRRRHGERKEVKSWYSR